MDYNKIYNQLMVNAKNRITDKNVYYESHHIVPKCIGGSNDKDNKVKLTYREHFLAHWLLHRQYPTNKSLAASFHIMAFGKSWREVRKVKGNYYPSSRGLEEARLAKVMARRGTSHSEETKQKISESMKGKTPYNYGIAPSEETKEKMRLAKVGKIRSDETKQKISDGKKKQVPTGTSNHRYGVKHTEETKLKMKEARKRREMLKHI